MLTEKELREFEEQFLWLRKVGLHTQDKWDLLCKRYKEIEAKRNVDG